MKAKVKMTKDNEKPKVLRVKAGAKYRGAREAWYKVLQEYDGKTAAQFLEATAKKAPSLTKRGTAEKPTGWLRFFQRQGVVSEITA